MSKGASPREILLDKIGYNFRSGDLLEAALTHKSAKNRENYERLEFLGDAVLALAVAEFLFIKFPASGEGELTKLRASLVSEEALSKIALYLGVKDALILAANEVKTNGKSRPSILADSYEAIIGAIFLDGGFDAAKNRAIAALEAVFLAIDPETLIADHKSRLQEITQASLGSLPLYRVINEMGPDHKKRFVVEVTAGEITRAAEGKSKKQAEQAAAKKVLEKLDEIGGDLR